MEQAVVSPRVSFECQDVADATCPNCDHRGMRWFYRASGVPMHTRVLRTSQEAALNAPVRDVVLASCHVCGFVTNLMFDARVYKGFESREALRSLSPAFNAFARSLAQQLVERYQLHGKTVLDIGTGKGEFLESMCEFGVGRGIGIGPTYVSPRHNGKATRRIEMIHDSYSARYAHLDADMICCRHTFEHIGLTLAFLRTIRCSIGERRDTVVFFEVPDAVRILREGAFWRICYEHCSYFSPASLAHVFRAAGFEVTELMRAHQGQHLLITAVPADGPTTPALVIEQEHASVTRFSTIAPRVMAHWRQVIDGYTRRGRPIVLWGSGSRSAALLSTLGITDQIEYVVDINPHRHQRYMPGTGQRVVPPDFLQTYQPALVIVMNPAYRDEIEKQIRRLGVDARCVAL